MRFCTDKDNEGHRNGNLTTLQHEGCRILNSDDNQDSECFLRGFVYRKLRRQVATREQIKLSFFWAEVRTKRPERISLLSLSAVLSTYIHIRHLVPDG